VLYFVTRYCIKWGNYRINAEYRWLLLLATYPKSGTHFGELVSLLILFKGELPPKTDLHTLTYAPEFDPSNKCRHLDEPSPTRPVRLLISHMPQHHVKYSETAKYLCIIRDPVNTLASQRRMDFLVLGPIVGQKYFTLIEFLKFHLYTRETGWLGKYPVK
jgi:hypothetical protein